MLPVAILCGGLGTRMRPITNMVPKSLIDIAGKPFLLWQLEYLRYNGVSRVVLNVCHMEEQIRNVINSTHLDDMEISIVSDGDSPSGTASALRTALPVLGSQFFVVYGDCLPICNFHHAEYSFTKSGKPALMAIYRVDDNRGNVAYINGNFLGYDKFVHSYQMQYRDYGMGILSSNVLEETTFDDLAQVYNSLGSNITGYVVGLRPYEIGSFAGLERVRRYFRYYTAVP